MIDKRFFYTILAALLVLVLCFSACQPAEAETVTATVTNTATMTATRTVTVFPETTVEIEIKPAPIHKVQISIAESFPEQIFVYINGGYLDACTTFNELKEERSGNTIFIEVTTRRPREAVCAQVYGYFEENVNLGSDFTSGETYTVDVNGTIATFEYP